MSSPYVRVETWAEKEKKRHEKIAMQYYAASVRKREIGFDREAASLEEQAHWHESYAAQPEYYQGWSRDYPIEVSSDEDSSGRAPNPHRAPR